MSSDPSASARRLVLVLGRRSGTSLFAGMLGRLGFRVPQPEVKADATNPRGFSEPRWVVDFHTRLMRRRRVTVFDSRPAAWEMTTETVNDGDVVADLTSWLTVQFVGAENVVVKDPRVAWFVALWLRCAEGVGVEPSFATVLRHPSHVVRSARESYRWQGDASVAAGWLNITLHAELATRGARRAFVRYDDLLEAWPSEISRVGESLGIPWLVGVDRARYPEVDSLVDPSLRRSATGWDELAVPSQLRSMVEDVWSRLSRMAEPGGDDDAARASLDAARDAYVNFYADVEAIAQSSLASAQHRAQSPATTSRAAKEASDGSHVRRRLPRSLARLVRPHHRERVRRAPSPWRLGAGGLATLPVRVALRVPPRYRERVPLPVVRVGLRLVRRNAGR